MIRSPEGSNPSARTPAFDEGIRGVIFDQVQLDAMFEKRLESGEQQ